MFRRLALAAASCRPATDRSPARSGSVNPLISDDSEPSVTRQDLPDESAHRNIAALKARPGRFVARVILGAILAAVFVALLWRLNTGGQHIGKPSSAEPAASQTRPIGR